MCHFITLVVASDDTAAIGAVMDGLGRCATSVSNASLAAVMLPGERQFLTNRRGCDCGTVLATSPPPIDEEAAEEALLSRERLRRKGWSDAKITRSLGNQVKAEARPSNRRSIDSLQLWETVIGDPARLPSVARAGLFVHFYGGGLETEVFAATRLKATRGRTILSQLEALREDQLLVFG